MLVAEETYSDSDGNYDEERFEDEDEKYLMEIQDGRRGVKAQVEADAEVVGEIMEKHYL